MNDKEDCWDELAIYLVSTMYDHDDEYELIQAKMYKEFDEDDDAD